MNEARRFLRYVLPTTASMVFLALCFWLTATDSEKELVLEFLERLKGVGGAVVVVFGSGGLGLLVAVFHHLRYTGYWC